jgi:hypothetical protein
MTSQIRSPQLETMAWTIERGGVDSIPSAVLRELGFEARQAGVHAAVTDTLLDTDAPSIVRSRAFGFIARHLGRRATTATDPTTTTPTTAAPTNDDNAPANRVPCAA